jgi:hypothetical protein
LLVQRLGQQRADESRRRDRLGLSPTLERVKLIVQNLRYKLLGNNGAQTNRASQALVAGSMCADVRVTQLQGPNSVRP